MPLFDPLPSKGQLCLDKQPQVQGTEKDRKKDIYTYRQKDRRESPKDMKRDRESAGVVFEEHFEPHKPPNNSTPFELAGAVCPKEGERHLCKLEGQSRRTHPRSGGFQAKDWNW